MSDRLKPKAGELYSRNGVLVLVRGILPFGDAFVVVLGKVAGYMF